MPIEVQNDVLKSKNGMIDASQISKESLLILIHISIARCYYFFFK